MSDITLRAISQVLDKPECGIFPDWTRSEYDAFPAMNCSSVKAGLDIEGKSYVANPRKIRHAWMGGEDEKTSDQRDSMAFGNALHIAVLESHRFETDVVSYPGKVRRGKQWDEFRDEHQAAGHVIIPATGKFGRDKVAAILTAVMELPEWELLAPYLGSCQREVAVIHWENGMAKKGLLDMPSESGLAYLDLKTTKVTNWSQYDSVSWKLGYWLSMGSYAHWWNQYSDWQVERCIQIVIVTVPPFDLLIRPMDPMSLSFGWETQVRACDSLKDAISSGVWTGSGGGMEVPLLLPTWAVPDESLEFTT